jgi:hypothetical protein
VGAQNFSLDAPLANIMSVVMIKNEGEAHYDRGFYQWLITFCAQQQHWTALLPPSLVHQAARLRNPLLLHCLLLCPNINPSIPDERTGLSALHEAVETAAEEGDESPAYDIIDTFASVPDRIDLLVEDKFGNTCVDLAIASRNYKLISTLLGMRRNDVMERVIMDRNGGVSLLVELEEENCMLAKDAGFFVKKSLIAPHSATLSNAAPEGEEADESKAGSEGDEQSLALSNVDAGGVTEVCALHEPVEEVSKNPTTADDLQKLQASNQLLTLLISELSGIVSEDCHYHSCFYNGTVFSDFCDQKNEL